MYIHLGGDKVIRSSELVAILDIAIENSSRISKQFFVQALQDKRIVSVSDEEPKSLVVTKDKLYYSPVSSATLKKRVNQIQTDR